MQRQVRHRDNRTPQATEVHQDALEFECNAWTSTSVTLAQTFTELLALFFGRFLVDGFSQRALGRLVFVHRGDLGTRHCYGCQCFAA